MTTGLIGRHKRLFIAGTDTAVGKTYFACCLIRYLAGQGERIGVMKPIETGIVSEKTSDAYLLRKAARSTLPIERISPYRFQTPSAPRVAALKEKKQIRIRKIMRQFRDLAAEHDWMIVEGAGGLMVPILKKFDMARLAQSLQVPLLLVSPQRLGTINQTLLSVYLAKSRGLNILAVILNQQWKKKSPPGIQENAKMIYESCNIPVLTFHPAAGNNKKNPIWEKLLG